MVRTRRIPQHWCPKFRRLVICAPTASAQMQYLRPTISGVPTLRSGEPAWDRSFPNQKKNTNRGRKNVLLLLFLRPIRGIALVGIPGFVREEWCAHPRGFIRSDGSGL